MISRGRCSRDLLPGIHPTACVDPEAVVSPAATVGPFCYVGKGAKVGDVILESHVSVGRYAKIDDGTHVFQRVVIGDFCEVGPRNRLLHGCILGADGYGYEFHQGAHQRVPQIGNVVTEADVDVGANTTIDRARFGSTVIGAGTKIDNQVQIAHNVRIGQALSDCCASRYWWQCRVGRWSRRWAGKLAWSGILRLVRGQ